MITILELINAMSPFLLLGFFLAGIMHAFVPNALYSRYLAKDNLASIFWATLFGIPLPLCSCGVIPTAMSLRREGASKGATVSFLIATPQTGVDSIIATFSLMGLPFAIVRPVAAILTALFGGTLVNIFRNKREEVVNIEAKVKPQTKEKVSFARKFISALKYGYVEMMQDIGKYLIIGLVVAGIITVAVPNEFFALFADNSLLSMLLVLLFALPMYLCATGSIPIAVALMLKGLSPGAALVLLMAGPAVNFASMLVVGKVLGKKTLFIYLLSVVLGSFLCGLAIDYLLPREWFVMPWTQMQSVVEHSHSFLSFNSLCTMVMIGLLVNAFVRKYSHGHSHSDCGCSSCADSCSDEKSSCECGGNKSECTCSTSETKMQEFKVEGMRCNHCKANVEKAVSSIQGVESVEVSLEDKTVFVKGNFTPDEVKKAIEELGFSVF
ncbi:MAG: permease [Paludibacteraceae bacterium]|nr:permease [Paludibacteraceae bacterium]